MSDAYTSKSRTPRPVSVPDHCTGKFASGSVGGRTVTRLDGWIDDPEIDCVITTGGTGVTGRDVTPEAFAQVRDKEIEGFGELFRWLSYAKIGTSTIQSRATACVARGTYIFALPGSTGAVRDAWDGILASQLDSRFRPCNFVELMPRLTER